MKIIGHRGGVVRLAYATVVFAFALAAHANAQTLPEGWSTSNIGNPAINGSASFNSGTFTLNGTGADIWNTSDQFTFVHRQISGDLTIVARVATLQNVNGWSKGGVMIRESLAANSKHSSVFATPSSGVAFQGRASTGGTSTHTSGGTGTAPVWLKLVRQSNTVTASRSANGTTWTTIGSATVSMGSTVYVGLAVTSHDVARTATATLSDVITTAGTGEPLPAGWTASDIGAPSLAGSTQYSSGAYTLRGAGEIGGTADQFHFVNRAVTGDVDIRARVASIEAIQPWTKGGVMLRDTLTPNSAFGMMFISGSSGTAFHRRQSAGAARTATEGTAVAAPYWVRLERRGSVVTGYQSSNGATWTAVGTTTMSTPTLYVGLIVASADATRLATGVLDNVVVTTPVANQPPITSLTAPANGATFTAPASMTVSATASDTDGTVTVVDFYAGATLIGSDATSPYSISWNGVAAGTYSLTALARDEDGAATTSVARTVTVSGTSLPSGWTATDIGAPALAGSTQYSGGSYTLRGAGEIGGTADQFHFVNRAVTGDVDIRARVASIEAIQPWSKAGVMLRDTLTPNSAFGMMFVSGSSGTAFHRRQSAGAARAATEGTAVAAPYWVRLERRGSVVTGYQSSNGATWTTIGTTTMSTPTLYVGLIVASADATRLATGVLDNVVVTTPVANQPPITSLTAPANGATFTAPASMTISATASDTDGTVTVVEFYAWGTMIGSDTTSPYSMPWNNVAAGSYALTSVARDNAGGMTTSATRDITVNPGALPRTAIFTASSNHATAVDRYFLEIFPAGANPLVANPVATRDLGKPAVVGGEIQVDVSTTTTGLPAGSYIATVTAIGGGGSTRSAASPTFVR